MEKEIMKEAVVAAYLRLFEGGRNNDSQQGYYASHYEKLLVAIDRDFRGDYGERKAVEYLVEIYQRVH